MLKMEQTNDWFSVLQTEERTQTAGMRLKPGKSNGEAPEAHKNSTRVLLVLKGEVIAQLEGDRKALSKDDMVVIPAGVKHKFTNEGRNDCVTFNSYSPPED